DRPAVTDRLPERPAVRIPGTARARARSVGHPAIRLRDGARRQDRRARQEVPRRVRPVHGEREGVGELGAAGGLRRGAPLRGPHGGYVMGSTGDWNDFSTELEQLSESNLVTAQLAYAYPKLAELADLRGDKAFAAQLRKAGAEDLATIRGQWTGRWYTR